MSKYDHHTHKITIKITSTSTQFCMLDRASSKYLRNACKLELFLIKY